MVWASLARAFSRNAAKKGVASRGATSQRAASTTRTSSQESSVPYAEFSQPSSNRLEQDAVQQLSAQVGSSLSQSFGRNPPQQEHTDINVNVQAPQQPTPPSSVNVNMNESFGGQPQPQPDYEQKAREEEEKKAQLKADNEELFREKLDKENIRYEKNLASIEKGPSALSSLILWIIYFVLYGISFGFQNSFSQRFVFVLIAIVVWLIFSLFFSETKMIFSALLVYSTYAILASVLWAAGLQALFVALFLPLLGLLGVFGVSLGFLRPPPVLFSSEYDNRKTTLRDVARAAHERIKASIKKNSSSAFRRSLALLKGKYVGLGDSAQKITFWIFFILIGILSLSTPLFRFSVPIQLSDFYVLFVLVILVLVANGLQLIRSGQWVSLLIWGLLNSFIFDLLVVFPSLEQYLGTDGAMIGIILFVLLALLFVLSQAELIPTHWILPILLIILLALMSPRLFGYVGSDAFERDVQDRQARAEVAWRNFNFIDWLTDYFNRQQRMVAGEYTEGSRERTHQFVGIDIDSITPTRNRFLEDQPVSLDISYRANTFFPLEVITSCISRDFGSAEIDQSRLSVRPTVRPTARCTFPSMTRGSHVIDVSAVFNYQSTVKVPFVVLTEDFAELLSTVEYYGSSQHSPERFLNPGLQPITSAGPVAIGVATSGNQYDLPFIFSPDQDRLVRLRFQINPDSRGGSMFTASQLFIDLPEDYRLLGCDIAQFESSDFNQFTRRQTYTAPVNVLNIEDYDSFVCDISVDRRLFQDLPWSTATMYLTIDYSYILRQSTSVRVD